MTSAAQSLQVVKVVSQIRARPYWLDVVYLKPQSLVALDTLPAIAGERLHPQGFPSRPARDVS